MTCSECFKPIEDDDVVEWSDGRPTHISCWERVQERKRKNKKTEEKGD